jgi:hypothetical protein
MYPKDHVCSENTIYSQRILLRQESDNDSRYSSHGYGRKCSQAKHQHPSVVLKKQETEKRKKYLQPCLDPRRSFVPFVVSTDGLLGFEAKNLLKQIAKRLTAKWEQPYSVCCKRICCCTHQSRDTANN